MRVLFTQIMNGALLWVSFLVFRLFLFPFWLYVFVNVRMRIAYACTDVSV